MAVRAEVLREGIIGRGATLGVARGFTPLPTPLPLTGGVVRVLGAILQIPVLAVLHAREKLSLGSSITFQFIGDDDSWHVGQPLEQLEEELLRGPLITPGLHQDVRYVPVLIHGPPERKSPPAVVYLQPADNSLARKKVVSELAPTGSKVLPQLT
jgi:hypothetical protein